MLEAPRILKTHAPAAVILIRVMVGAVFLSEGIQKFLFPEQAGSGRFAKIGLPMPELLAFLVGSTEIFCGALVVLGLATRLAVLPLLVIMFAALWTTKAPILPASGFWKMAHEARTDFAMILGCLFLLAVGAGKWSVDVLLGAPSRKMQHDGS